MRALIVGVLALLLLVQYHLWVGDGSMQNVARLERELQTQAQINDRLRERNRVLAREVDELKTGHDSIEERARKDMGMIKKGEKFYLILDNPAPKPAP